MCGSLKLVPIIRHELGDVSNELPVPNVHLSLYRPLIIIKIHTLTVLPRPVNYKLGRFFLI